MTSSTASSCRAGLHGEGREERGEKGEEVYTKRGERGEEVYTKRGERGEEVYTKRGERGEEVYTEREESAERGEEVYAEREGRRFTRMNVRPRVRAYVEGMCACVR
jgi:hypothetical protein